MKHRTRGLVSFAILLCAVTGTAQLTKSAIDALKNVKLFPSQGLLKLPAGTRPSTIRKAFSHLYLQVMSGTDDLRDGGTATFFMEMADGSRATAALAIPGVPLPGHTLLNWRWDVPDGLNPEAIRHVGISTQLHKGSRPTDRSDTWRISRVNAFFYNESTTHELSLFNEPVPYSFTAAVGADEWKSGEVASFRGDQFTRTDEIAVELVASSEPGDAWNPTVGWQVMIDLADGRRIESLFDRSRSNEGVQLTDILPSAEGRLTGRGGRVSDGFGREHKFFRIKVPGIARNEIRRVLVMGQTQTVGAEQARKGGRVAQVIVWSKQSATQWREWMVFHPDFDVTPQNNLWASPAMAPLSLPQDLAGQLGVEIWAGPDDSRSDSRIQLLAVERPKDMFSQPRKYVLTVAEPRAGNTIAGIGRGSNVPANSMMRLGYIEPVPLPDANSGVPRLSSIMSLGLMFEPGPGGGTWNPDTFTIRHVRFFYSDGKVLREIWSGYNLGITLNTAITAWTSGDPGLRFGVPLNLDPRRIGGR